MAHHIETTLRVNAPAEKVWETLGDFSSIERFSSKVESSPIVGEVAAGLGTKRICTFYDKSTVVEEIVGYQEGESLDIELSEFSMPLESLRAQMKVTPVDDARSDVSFAMDFVVKYGPIGWLMGTIMMKPMMSRVTRDVLSGLAFHVVTGNTVGSEMPSAAALAAAVA
jgi:ribosome-associated toxin RatA of RatAB toxin-antitoxin module